MMKKLSFIVAALIIVGFIGAYKMPAVVTKIAEKELSSQLATEVTINNLDISLLKGQLTIQEIAIKDYPEFSTGNIFTLHGLVFDIKPENMFDKTLNIENFSIQDMTLNINGSLQKTNVIKLADTLKAKGAAEEQAKQAHANETADQHASHDHSHKQDLRLKIKNIDLNDLTLNIVIDKPIKIEAKDLTVANISIKNIGGEKGVSMNNALQELLTSINAEVKTTVDGITPVGTKVLEKAKDSFNEIKKNLNQENLDKAKEQANELINKYF